MKPMLRAGDCLCRNWLRVDAFQHYGEVVKSCPAPAAEVFAVFGEDGAFMGLVGNRQAALFPNRIFADLLVRRPAPPVPADAGLDEVQARLREECCNYLAVLGRDGQFAGVISQASLFATLTGRLATELEYHKMASMAFETTSEGVMITDATPAILHINRAFTETTGYAAEDVIGKNPGMLHSGRHGREFYEAIWQSLRETGRWEGEIWNRRKSGEIYPEWLHINSVRDESGDATHYVGVFSDIGPNKEIQRELQQMAYYDTLTGLPNRRLFIDRLECAVAQSYRVQDGFSLLFIDLDRFKNINDAYGHELGDELLKTVARRIHAEVRESDTVARLGGDEFVAILHDCHDRDDCGLVVEKIRRAVNEPIVLGGRELSVSAAIGVCFYPEDGGTVSDIVRNADTAMYRAKEDGSGISFYRPEMNAGLSERMEIENAIRRGLADGEFRLVWQPQVDLSGGTLCGAEVLARWRRGERDIPPATFIPIAEGSGLIDMLGDWVFRQAVMELAELRKACPDCPLLVAVNFSPLQLDGESAFDRVVGVMEEHDVPADQVEIEVTESAIMGRRPGAAEFLRRVAEHGIALAVDDFGTGYSNLANLKQVHVDRIKIDGSFVRDLEHDETSRQIVQAVISMAHSLNLKVVAECIETPGQRDILRGLGCDYGQGYLFSRPIPLPEFRNFCNDCVDGRIILPVAQA